MEVGERRKCCRHRLWHISIWIGRVWGFSGTSLEKSSEQTDDGDTNWLHNPRSGEAHMFWIRLRLLPENWLHFETCQMIILSALRNIYDSRKKKEKEHISLKWLTLTPNLYFLYFSTKDIFYDKSLCLLIILVFGKEMYSTATVNITHPFCWNVAGTAAVMTPLEKLTQDLNQKLFKFHRLCRCSYVCIHSLNVFATTQHQELGSRAACRSTGKSVLSASSAPSSPQ